MTKTTEIITILMIIKGMIDIKEMINIIIQINKITDIKIIIIMQIEINKKDQDPEVVVEIKMHQ